MSGWDSEDREGLCDILFEPGGELRSRLLVAGHDVAKTPLGLGRLVGVEDAADVARDLWSHSDLGGVGHRVSHEMELASLPGHSGEAGTPNIADAIGLGAALDYVTRLGRERIAVYEHELLEYATGKLMAIDGLRLVGTAREKVGVLSFVIPGLDPIEIGKALDREGIAVRAGHHCAQPSLQHFGVEATVRPSLAFYNTTSEIDRLADAVVRLARRRL